LYNRYVRWAVKSVWADLFHALANAYGLSAEVLIDSSAVKAHRSASGGRGGERNQAIGRSRGGRTTKLHALTDAHCRPLKFLLTGGNIADCAAGERLLAKMPPHEILHGDKGYDSDAIRRQVESSGTMPNIPPKTNRKWKNCFSPLLYRNRNAIERMFCRLKDFVVSLRDMIGSPRIISLASTLRPRFAIGCKFTNHQRFTSLRIKMTLQIRAAQINDAPAIWGIIGPTIRAGETYALDQDMAEADALAYWLGDDRKTFVAEQDGLIIGTYYIRANQAGGGKHICNCGYMTSAAATGRGIARAMCEHSLDVAQKHGFSGMQFNFVVSVNARAVQLWQSLGFEIVGHLPKAFLHPKLGYVDALVMFRPLNASGA
jgi:transposase/GNAT superfamily N-acetyltransferase